MTTYSSASASLAARFAALQAERERTWAPAQLAANAGQRAGLIAAHNPAASHSGACHPRAYSGAAQLGEVSAI